MKVTRQYDIMCPFFSKTIKPCGIECEGCVPMTLNVTKFTDEQRRASHMDKYCYADYKSCPVAEMVNQKYEVEI